MERPVGFNESRKCGLCQGTLNVPKQLPCAHTFCLACLDRHLEHLSPAERVCPTCNIQIGIPTAELPNNKYFDALLTLDTTLANLNETRNNTQEVEGPVRVHIDCKCDVCGEDTPVNETDSGVKYCADCDQKLCTSCNYIHSLSNNGNRHRVMNVFATDAEYLCPRYDRICEQHQDERVVHYCLKCGVALCEKCLSSQHLDHNFSAVDVVGPPLRIQLYACSLIINNVLPKLKTRISLTQEHQKTLQDKLVKSSNDNTKQAIQDLLTNKNWERFDEYCKNNDDQIGRNYKASCRSIIFLTKKKVLLEGMFEKMNNLIMKAHSCDIACRAARYIRMSERIWKTTDSKHTESPLFEFQDYLTIATQISPSIGWKTINFPLTSPHKSLVIGLAPTWAGPHAKMVIHDDTTFAVGLGLKHDELWAYSSTSMTWSKRASMAYGRTGAAVVIVNKVIFVMGGSGYTNNQETDLIQTYDLATSRWNIDGHLSKAVYQAACVAYEGRIYLFCVGSITQPGRSSIQIYDTNTKTCVVEPGPVPFTKKLLPIIYKSHVIFLGSGDCWVYDLHRKAFSRRAPDQLDMKQFNAAIVDDMLYVIGGRTAGPNANRFIDLRSTRAQNIITETYRGNWSALAEYEVHDRASPDAKFILSSGGLTSINLNFV